ncbi:MAG: CYTH domain-containing protein [Gammaproteobacteria bacterium]|nr:CYTH domain-containing protein [Gammaproteobacteria bacterium]
METEFEATFTNIDKTQIRARLEKAGAALERPEYLQKRIPFHLPKEKRSDHIWARVRDEGDKITMSVKTIGGAKIDDQKEICIEVSSFDNAVELLTTIGCVPKAFQETRRELWLLDGVEVTIDEWPFLEPFVEVEGESEAVVISASKKLGFNYDDALFCAVGKLYADKYGIDMDQINDCTKQIIFDMENPFLIAA